jgi:hypothetical protein
MPLDFILSTACPDHFKLPIAGVGGIETGDALGVG